MPTLQPGSIVRCRNRDWVLLPGDNPGLHLLRPLTGAVDEVVAVHKHLSELLGYTYAEERVEAASFPVPTTRDLSDAAGAHLLWQAARLLLREGATPFRSLGRVSIRPRTYQFVPLLMALRIDPVRLFIADDVGVGKTIEALLIARELFDRGEIKRLCVLCPPYLCDQWQRELSGKFGLDAVIVRSGTVNQLDRRKTVRNESIYRHYPVIVVSIDFIKSDRNKPLFLLDCPEFVIVDEAHGASQADPRNVSQQQRHALIADLAKDPKRHMLFLTATPHSGVEAGFRSLLGVLDPEFGGWSMNELSEHQRIRLARHFVQRTRRDIEKDWEGQSCFPKRIPSDETYPLSTSYKDLFSETFAFCSEVVRTSQDLEKSKQRVRFWGALALLRCVMSSPAAAVAALEKRSSLLLEPEEEFEFRRTIFESSDDLTDDTQPTPAIDSAEGTFTESDRRRLRDLGKKASFMLYGPEDTKLTRCAELVAKLLKSGFHPILWCRYIATADYLAEGLRRLLTSAFPDLRVIAITGTLSDEERRAKIAELIEERRRVLVATDCLSEGINLQDGFNAVIHYDLPWNPNRLEQREGRVDRFGQLAREVKTIRYFSPDNPVDGVVIRVLLDKAREIHRTLGTHVPVPEESETVTQAVLNALFFKGKRVSEPQEQLKLDFGEPAVETFHRRWDQEAMREKENRTRFAQRALKPDEVRRELEATDAVLGAPEAVRSFVINACQRLNLSLRSDRREHIFLIACDDRARSTLPDAVSMALPPGKSGWWPVSFVSPTPEGAEYLGRNHRFVTALAQYLLEEALTKGAAARAARCGVIRTKAVSRLTLLYLLRVRFLLEQPDKPPLLAEEVVVSGHRNLPGNPGWLSDSDALNLLEQARPDANISPKEKEELAALALEGWHGLLPAFQERLSARGEALAQSHRRIRQAASLRVRGLTVKPQLPPDLLGLLVLQPVAGEGP